MFRSSRLPIVRSKTYTALQLHDGTASGGLCVSVGIDAEVEYHEVNLLQNPLLWYTADDPDTSLSAAVQSGQLVWI